MELGRLNLYDFVASVFSLVFYLIFISPKAPYAAETDNSATEEQQYRKILLEVDFIKPLLIYYCLDSFYNRKYKRELIKQR